jgi:hypothetical protein
MSGATDKRRDEFRSRPITLKRQKELMKSEVQAGGDTPLAIHRQPGASPFILCKSERKGQIVSEIVGIFFVKNGKKVQGPELPGPWPSIAVDG